MVGWGIAIVLMAERGLSWWQVALIVLGCMLAEFVGNAFVDGIKRGRREVDEEDQRAVHRGRAAAGG